MIRAIFSVLWLIFFIGLFFFALNSTNPTELRFFLGMTWQAPLVALLLLFFLAGVVFGLCAMIPMWFRQRLALRRLQQQQAKTEAAAVDLAADSAAITEANLIQSVARSARAVGV